MGESVKGLVAGYIEALEGKPGRGGKPVAFSMRLGEREHAKLLWLAKSLNTQKTPLAEKLLGAAVDEAIEQYVRWASPDDPEALLEEIREDIEGPGRDPGAHHGPEHPGGGPHEKPHGKPHGRPRGRPPGPKRPG